MEIKGLNKIEFETYINLLRLKRATVLELCKVSNEKRTNLYRYLDRLMSEGLVSQIYEGKKHYFVAEPPKSLMNYINNQKDKIEKLLPELENIEQEATDRPKIKYYEGKSSIKNLYKEMLDDRKEIVAIASTDVLLHTLDFHDWFARERVKRKIPVRIIVPDTKIARRRSTPLSERKFAKGLPMLLSAFFVFGNKVATFSMKRWITVVMMENKEIADGFRAIFDGYWKKLK